MRGFHTSNKIPVEPQNVINTFMINSGRWLNYFSISIRNLYPVLSKISIIVIIVIFFLFEIAKYDFVIYMVSLNCHSLFSVVIFLMGCISFMVEWYIVLTSSVFRCFCNNSHFSCDQ